MNVGGTATLECAAVGDPQPQIQWVKDGGGDFPAALERRFHVLPSDHKYYIVMAKPEDTGTYTCSANNTAGIVEANSTLTVLGKLSCINFLRFVYFEC